MALIPCIMSSSNYRDIPPNIDDPSLHDHSYSYPYDPSSQSPSQPLTANSFIGTPLPEDKPNNVFHLLCGNPSGFTIGPRGGDFIDYCKEVCRFQADTSCLYEHNLDSYNHKVRNILYKTTQRSNSKLTTASSAIPATSTFKPGGTMILTQGSSIG